MDYTLEVVTPATIPASWQDLMKHQCRLETSETYDDDFIDALTEEAYEYVSEKSDLTLLTTIWKLTLPCFPISSGSFIYLPRPPLASVSSIDYTDTAGDAQTLAGSGYDVTSGRMSSISVAYGESWPTAINRPGAVQITYTSGTADSGVPRAAMRAIKLLVAHWYLHREDAGDVKNNIPHGVNDIIEHLRPGDEFFLPIRDTNTLDRYSV